MNPFLLRCSHGFARCGGAGLSHLLKKVRDALSDEFKLLGILHMKEMNFNISFGRVSTITTIHEKQMKFPHDLRRIRGRHQ